MSADIPAMFPGNRCRDLAIVQDALCVSVDYVSDQGPSAGEELFARDIVKNETARVASFLAQAVTEFAGCERGSVVRVMDFGCGKGQLVSALSALGFDACGCDVADHWAGDKSLPVERLRIISPSPYRVPFADNSFDVVVSTSVLEHVRNKEECFREICRVLKPGGCAMHLFPGKWYLPSEPHLYVPLVNFFWPRCFSWWFSFWAMLGVRNEFQKAKPWKVVVGENACYCREKLSYWSTSQYQALSCAVFEENCWPMEFYLAHADTRLTRFLGVLPSRHLAGLLYRELRTSFMLQKKRK